MIALKDDAENVEKFVNLAPEETLIRWINYHLRMAGCPRRITNLSTDLQDGEVYTVLMHQLKPQVCGLQGLQEQDATRRAEMVLENAQRLNCKQFLSPQDIVHANEKLNLAFVANLFNKHPGMENATSVLSAEAEAQRAAEVEAAVRAQMMRQEQELQERMAQEERDLRDRLKREEEEWMQKMKAEEARMKSQWQEEENRRKEQAQLQMQQQLEQQARLEIELAKRQEQMASQQQQHAQWEQQERERLEAEKQRVLRERQQLEEERRRRQAMQTPQGQWGSTGPYRT